MNNSNLLEKLDIILEYIIQEHFFLPYFSFIWGQLIFLKMLFIYF